MTTKTQQCDECKHFDPSWAAGAIKRVCKLKHKPRFYYAQLDKLGQIPGWKRKCDDFQPKEQKQ